MKTVSVVIPTYNEEENIPLVYERVKNVFEGTLTDYDFRILFVDNCSKDSSRAKIRKLAGEDRHVQYIFYVKNFGYSKSTFYGLTQSKGDCSVLMNADLQEPPEMIVEFVREWEKGNKVVAGIKNKSRENPVMYFIRKCYYWFANKVTEIDHIDQFDGFGLYDASVVKVFAQLDDPLPYLRGMVAELAPECKKVYYEQKRREHGKSSFNFTRLYDTAMLGLTSYSKALMRISMLVGLIIAIAGFVIAIVTFICKVTGANTYPTGTAAILCGVFFLGGVQLVFLGILGEYISNISIRTMHRPVVVEEERKMD